MQLDSVTSSASSDSSSSEAPAKKKKAPAKKAKARTGKSSGAKGKGGKTSFVIWVDAKQGRFIKAKAKAAGLSQADYFRRALKLPTSAK